MCEHNWVEEGGRPCRKNIYPEWRCSQDVFVCSLCGEVDYGYEGGSGWEQCKDCDTSKEKRKYTFIDICNCIVRIDPEKKTVEYKEMWV